jgi:hypothetical protein
LRGLGRNAWWSGRGRRHNGWLQPLTRASQSPTCPSVGHTITSLQHHINKTAMRSSTCVIQMV